MLSEQDIRQVVTTNDKQRFALLERDHLWYIRANQGHSEKLTESFDDEKMHERIVEPIPICIHGTTQEAFRIICKSGLKPMSRKHVHFAEGLPGDEKVVSGARWNAQVFIYLDMKRAMEDGMVFYRPKNGVILTKGLIQESIAIPYRYVDHVEFAQK